MLGMLARGLCEIAARSPMLQCRMLKPSCESCQESIMQLRLSANPAWNTGRGFQA
jgi:hypothetical protein